MGEINYKRNSRDITDVVPICSKGRLACYFKYNRYFHPGG